MKEHQTRRIGLLIDFYSLSLILALASYLFYIHANIIPLTWPKLFGHKSDAMFDLWFFQHFACGCVAGWMVTTFIAENNSLRPRNTLMFCMCVLVAACSWEVFECMMELNVYEPIVCKWKNGPEHWTNRFIADPGAFFLGAFLARYRPRITISAFVFAVLWLVLNVRQPTCMTIQEQIFKNNASNFFIFG